MSSSESFVDLILEQISKTGRVAYRKMFGEYALYCNDKVIGLICNDTLYIKITEPGKLFVGKYYQEGYAYPGAKVSIMIDGEKIEDDEWLSQLVKITADSLPLPKPKKLIQLHSN